MHTQQAHVFRNQISIILELESSVQTVLQSSKRDLKEI